MSIALIKTHVAAHVAAHITPLEWDYSSIAGIGLHSEVFT